MCGKPIRQRLLSALLCLCVLFWPVTGWAAGYQVTEAELTQLEQTFAELKSINSVLLTDSTQSQKDLIRALQLLKESQVELQKLQTQLATLKNESLQAGADLKQAQSSLIAANQSFEAYAKEQKKIQARLKTERALWMVVAAGAFYLAASK